MDLIFNRPGRHAEVSCYASPSRRNKGISDTVLQFVAQAIPSTDVALFRALLQNLLGKIVPYLCIVAQHFIVSELQ